MRNPCDAVAASCEEKVGGLDRDGKEAQPVLDLMKIFESAFDVFLEQERKNIIKNISERNLCGRLMIYLDKAREEQRLYDYYTDTEYNRNLGEVKRIGDKPITCDLILHSRGELPRDNLIAIEMKKTHHKKIDKDADRKRLIDLTSPHEGYRYELGLFIELGIAQAKVEPKVKYMIEIYRNGKKNSQKIEQ